MLFHVVVRRGEPRKLVLADEDARAARTLQRLQRLAIGDAEDPGRHARVAVEAVGLLPDDHHRVVQYLLDEVGTPGDAEQEAHQAAVVGAIERLEGAPILGGDLPHEPVLDGIRIERRLCRGRR